MFLQKLTCPTCGRIMGGKATRKKNQKEYYYYHCLVCNNNIKEKDIEKQIRLGGVKWQLLHYGQLR